MKKLLFLTLLIPSFISAANVRNPKPNTPDQIWQNDQDLLDIVNKRIPLNGTIGQLLIGQGIGKNPIFSSTVTAPTTLGGSTTNDVASAGYQGEISSASTAGYSNAAVSNSYGNIVSKSFTPGSWNICATINANLNGATMTRSVGAISQFSGNTVTDQVSFINDNDISVPTATSNAGGSFCYPLQLATTTTLFLKARAVYSAGTPQYAGFIYGERYR